jgi:hypothetical protein
VQRACGRCGSGPGGGHISRRAVSPHEANSWTPSTERSDRGESVNGYILSAQGSSGRLLAPTSPGRPPARDRRAGPRDCAADILCVGQSAFKCPVLGAREIDCTVTGCQVAPLLEPANIRPVKDRGNPSDRHRHVRTGGPSVDANAAHPSRPSWDGRTSGGREMVLPPFTVET